MSYIKKKVLSWTASTSPDVLSYILRWKQPPDNIDYDPVTNPGFNCGLVTQIDLPVTGMPLADGDYKLGVTAKDDAENESDPIEQTYPFDFVVPNSPTLLQIA